LGTNLEVWSCQAQADKKPLGYYDENTETLLKENEDNQYFYKRTILKECIDCSILGNCRGGRRVTHHDQDINKITCCIKRAIMGYIFKTVPRFNNSQSRHNCCRNGQDLTGFETIIDSCLQDIDPNDKGMFTETPQLAEITEKAENKR
jgi:radical SAM protein with 4Fe4S-binding SPASM domain